MIRRGIIVPGLVWIVPAAVIAQDIPRMPEYQVKSLYLGVLCDYVQWPSGSDIGDKSQPFRIGILGESPFLDFLDSTWKAKHIQGKQVRIRISSRIMDLMDSHIIFICESESDRLSEILKTLQGKPIVTIGDTPEFALRGVMVNLYMQQKQVRFEVNLHAIRSSGLEFSSQFLRLAKIVK